MKERSEQWWELGLMVGTEYVRVKATRSRMIRERWLNADHDAVPCYREMWTVGGKFDGECYAATPATLANGSQVSK